MSADNYVEEAVVGDNGLVNIVFKEPVSGGYLAEFSTYARHVLFESMKGMNPEERREFSDITRGMPDNPHSTLNVNFQMSPLDHRYMSIEFTPSYSPLLTSFAEKIAEFRPKTRGEELAEMMTWPRLY